MHVCVKMMSKESKEALTVLIVTHVTQVESQKWCFQLLCNTVYRVMVLILLILTGSKCTLYKGPLAPSKGEDYLFESLPVLWV